MDQALGLSSFQKQITEFILKTDNFVKGQSSFWTDSKNWTKGWINQDGIHKRNVQGTRYKDLQFPSLGTAAVMDCANTAWDWLDSSPSQIKVQPRAEKEECHAVKKSPNTLVEHINSSLACKTHEVILNSTHHWYSVQILVSLLKQGLCRLGEPEEEERGLNRLGWSH